MAKTSSAILEKKIADAALRLIAVRGWKNITPERVTKTAKISAAQIKQYVPNKNALLPIIVRAITAEASTQISKPAPRDIPRDRLFEIIMARLDVLQKHRKAILSVIGESKRDSGMLCALIPAQKAAVSQMVLLAGLQKNGVPEPIVAGGVAVIYAVVLHVWSRDETLDMSKTMAALDRALRLTGRVAEILFRK